MMNLEKTKEVLLKGANIAKAWSLSMQKNFNQVMRGIDHIQTQRTANIASIPEFLRNINRWVLKKIHTNNTK